MTILQGTALLAFVVTLILGFVLGVSSTKTPKRPADDPKDVALYDAIKQAMAEEGYRVDEFNYKEDRGLSVAYDPSWEVQGAASVSASMPARERVQVLLHEWGHLKLLHSFDRKQSLDTHEVQAETIAYEAARLLGIDSYNQEIYIAQHIKDGGETPDDELEPRLRNIARHIADAIQKQ